MLDDDEVVATVRDLWASHRDELSMHDRVRGYVSGRYGVPEVPEGSNEELSDLAKMSVKNVLSLVRDAFAQNLAVVGFRSPEATENEPVWALWQRHRLDARQAEVHRPSVTYGVGYGVALRDAVRFRSPRQLFAVYSDPQIDEWPVYALETWVDTTGRKPVRKGALLDGDTVYPVVLGSYTGGASQRISAAIDPDEQPYKHGSNVCPVVRFVNARDAEDMVCGEIYPLIGLQRAINAVNFDRLVVSRFGAFPQKYAIGWAPADRDELLRASSSALWTFEDDTVKVGTLAAAGVEPYNAILEEMVAHVAMTAQIPVAAVTGNVTNLSAEALAMAEAPHQRKLAEKRQSFGESWEQLLRLLGKLNDVKVDDSAEVIWRETEARSFAQVVDGIGKLVAAGVPIGTLLDDVPGWTQQRADAARQQIADSVDPIAALQAHLESQVNG